MKGKRGLAIILTLSMLMYLLTGFGPAVMAADARFAAEKPFEAENGKLSGAMKKTKDTGASGGCFISVTEGARVDEPAKMQPEASYVFTVPVDGEYQFWTKSYMKDEGADSFWARFDENAYIYCGGAVTDGYTWKNHSGVTAKLTAGTHTLDIVHRENNTKFDMICITTDPEKSIGKEVQTTAKPTASASPTASATATVKPGTMDWSKVNVVEIGDTGSVLFEAEDMTIEKSIAAIENNAGASKKKAVAFITDAKEQKDALLPGAVSFRVKAPRGTYKVWMRYAAATDGNDSAYKSINGAAYTDQAFGVTGSKETFAWTLVGSIKFVSDEEQNVRVRPREGGGVIDQFVITKSATYVPEGLLTEAPAVGADVVQPLPADVYPKPTITPPAEHPRLLFRASDIPMIKENMEKEQSTNARVKWQDFLKQETDGVIDTPKDASSGHYNTSVLAIIEGVRLCYKWQ